MANRDAVGVRLGRRVRKIRDQRGLSGAGLAAKSGLHRTYLSQLETGGRDSVTLITLERIADALGVTMSTLLAEDEEEDQGLNPSISGLLQRVLTKLLRMDESGLRAVLDVCEARPIVGAVRGAPDESREGWTALCKIGRIGRGPDLPALFLALPEFEDLSDDKWNSVFKKKILERLEDQVKISASRALTRWLSLAKEGGVEFRACFQESDIRPVSSLNPTGAMAYLPNAPGVMREELVFSPPIKVVIEPRTLVAWVDLEKAGVSQSYYVVVPEASREVGRVARRLAGFISCLDPSDVPAGIFFFKGRRPTLAQLRQLQVPANLVELRGPWESVDEILSRVDAALARLDDGTGSVAGDGYDRLMERRAALPFRAELRAAILEALPGGSL